MINYCEKCKYEIHDDDDYGCVLFGIECMKCKSFNEDEMGCNVHQKKIQFLAHRIKKRFDSTFRNDYSTPLDGKFSGRKFYKFPTGRTLRNECEYPYKPRMKGGHTHNHIYNKCNKHLFRGRGRRKIDRKDKPEFVRTFYLNVKLGNATMNSLMHTIFYHNKKEK